MESKKVIFLAKFCLFLGAIGSFVSQDAQAHHISYYSGGCSGPQQYHFDASSQEVGYIGPSPGGGQKLCVIGRKHLLLCVSLDASFDFIAAEPCYIAPTKLCPSIKGVPYGLGCLTGSSNFRSAVVAPNGKKLCVEGMGYGRNSITACADVSTPWFGAFASKGLLRGAKDLAQENAASEEVQEIDLKEEAFQEVGVDAKDMERVTKDVEEEHRYEGEEDAAEELGGDIQQNILEERDEQSKAVEVAEAEFGEKKTTPTDQKVAEFSPVASALPEGESWFLCWFNNGLIDGCATLDTTESWVPMPYPGFSGLYVSRLNSNVTDGYTTGSVTMEGIQTALFNAFSFFTNLIG